MHCISFSILVMLTFITVGYSQGEIEKLPSSVNTDLYDESAPVLSKDGTRLFFTRTGYPDFEASLLNPDGQLTSNEDDEVFQKRLSEIYSQIAGTFVPDPYTSVYNQDIWFVYIEDDSIRYAVHPGYPLNNALPNSLVSTGMKADEYVVINQFYEDGSMYAGFSRVNIYEDGSHNFPQPMHVYDFNVRSSDVNLTMSPGGHVLILSLERPDSRGQNDLYVSFYMRDNVWSSPEHMGTVINTEFQETTPHISPDKRFIYFSSNRPGGPGGNDIYVSERLDYTWKNWSEPVVLKGGVNSPYDDSQPSYTKGNNYMYFTSRRDGSSDIFRMRLTPMPQLKKSLYVRGIIVDATTGKPIRSELIWGPQSTKDYLEFFNSYNGQFEAVLSEYEPYKFLPRKAGYLAQRTMVDPRLLEKEGKDTIELVLYLTPKGHETLNEEVESEISSNETSKTTWQSRRQKESSPEPEKEVFFYDINFLRAQAIILTKSHKALQELLTLMKQNPTMEILIEGHTDNVGDEAALIHLSEQRAAAVRDYLVHHGIDKKRIQVRGMGATKPIHVNDTESGREKNRRVEIQILKK
jgi:outer membrane protein OmpA-like peptidoglycan-associated protein